jgi:hypothetical protein
VEPPLLRPDSRCCDPAPAIRGHRRGDVDDRIGEMPLVLRYPLLPLKVRSRSRFFQPQKSRTMATRSSARRVHGVAVSPASRPVVDESRACQLLLQCHQYTGRTRALEAVLMGALVVVHSASCKPVTLRPCLTAACSGIRRSFSCASRVLDSQ